MLLVSVSIHYFTFYIIRSTSINWLLLFLITVLIGSNLYVVAVTSASKPTEDTMCPKLSAITETIPIQRLEYVLHWFEHK